MARPDATTTTPPSDGAGVEPGSGAGVFTRSRTHVGRLVLIALLATGIFLAIFAVSMTIQFAAYFLEGIADSRGDAGKRKLDTEVAHAPGD